MRDHDGDDDHDKDDDAIIMIIIIITRVQSSFLGKQPDQCDPVDPSL